MDLMLSEREKRLLDILSEDAGPSITEISEQLGVSAATIRNDLNALTEKGIIIRIRGKSIPAFHPDILARQKQNIEAKKRIARAAAGMIQNGDTVFIDSGTTVALVPRYLLGKRDVHLVTYSTMVLPYARINPGIRLTIVGGEFRPAIDCLVGKFAVEGFSNFHVRLAFIGTTGFSIAEGITNMLLESAEVIRRMCDYAERIILLADSSKYDRLGFAKVFPLGRISEIITDKEMSQQALESLRGQGLEVTVV